MRVPWGFDRSANIFKRVLQKHDDVRSKAAAWHGAWLLLATALFASSLLNVFSVAANALAIVLLFAGLHLSVRLSCFLESDLGADAAISLLSFLLFLDEHLGAFPRDILETIWGLPVSSLP